MVSILTHLDQSCPKNYENYEKDANFSHLSLKNFGQIGMGIDSNFFYLTYRTQLMGLTWLFYKLEGCM